MLTIKRYPNRKLYDTRSKRYISLAEITALIHDGVEIRVLDHPSGDDLTALTLTQIILEMQKKQDSSISKKFLTSLIRSGGGKPQKRWRNVWQMPPSSNPFDDEIRTRFQALVYAGELTVREGLQLQDQVLVQAPQLIREQQLDEQIASLITKRSIPLKQDLQRLNEQLEEISLKLVEKTGEKTSD